MIYRIYTYRAVGESMGRHLRQLSHSSDTIGIVEFLTSRLGPPGNLGYHGWWNRFIGRKVWKGAHWDWGVDVMASMFVFTIEDVRMARWLQLSRSLFDYEHDL